MCARGCPTRALAVGVALALARLAAVGAVRKSSPIRNVAKMHHQTSVQAGARILATGKLMPGLNLRSPLFPAAAAYLSATPEGTNQACLSGRGFMIEVEVDLGRTCPMSLCGKGWHLDSYMLGVIGYFHGYDSAMISPGCSSGSHATPTPADERTAQLSEDIAIFSSAQVKSMRGWVMDLKGASGQVFEWPGQERGESKGNKPDERGEAKGNKPDERGESKGNKPDDQ